MEYWAIVVEYVHYMGIYVSVATRMLAYLRHILIEKGVEPTFRKHKIPT